LLSDGADGVIEWNIHIGRPIIEKRGCAPVLATLKEKTEIESFKCEDDGHGQTVLTFESTFQGSAHEEVHDRVMEGLQEGYPSVHFLRDNICRKSPPPY
jgi:hypothetical protein